MAFDVKVHLKSVQKADNMADINHTDTDGRLSVSSGNRFLLRFDTTDENGGVTSTSVKSTDGERITVIRKGTANTKMEFDADTPTPFLYSTPIGTLGFMLRTDEISLILDQSPSLSLIMRYQLYNNGEIVSENRIEITAV